MLVDAVATANQLAPMLRCPECEGTNFATPELGLRCLFCAAQVCCTDGGTFELARPDREPVAQAQRLMSHGLFVRILPAALAQVRLQAVHAHVVAPRAAHRAGAA